jgi:hypothetical protein
MTSPAAATAAAAAAGAAAAAVEATLASALFDVQRAMRAVLNLHMCLCSPLLILAAM